MKLIKVGKDLYINPEHIVFVYFDHKSKSWLVDCVNKECYFIQPEYIDSILSHTQ